VGERIDSRNDASEPPLKVGDPVTYFDNDGQPHIGAVSQIWSQECINILCEDGNLAPTSVPPKRPGMTGYYFVRGHVAECIAYSAELAAE
jgi:hypothetical protein